MPKAPRRQVGGYSVNITDALNHGSSKIKKKIRDIERLLKKDALPSDMRIENERALKTLKFELDNVKLDQKAKKLSSRYQKVKFFERTKALRKYNQAVKKQSELEKTKQQQESTNSDVKEIKKELKKHKKVLRHAEVELAYIFNYPPTEKYISLYKEVNVDGDDLKYKEKKGNKKTELRRIELKKQIAEKLDNGTLEVSIEDALKIANGNGGHGKKKSLRVNNDNQKGIDDKEDVAEGGDGVEEDDFFE